MDGLNRFEFIGGVAATPELRYSPNGGLAVLELEVTIYKYVRGGGQKPVVVKVKFFGDSAEQIKESTVVGSRIFIEGEISVDEWSDKQTNQPRSKMVLNGNKFIFLDRRGEAAAPPPRPAAPARGNTPWSKPATPPAQPDLPKSKEDDVPF